jgi:hypothetical protein
MNNTATFRINVSADGIPEGTETLIMGISQTPNGSILATSQVVNINPNNT